MFHATMQRQWKFCQYLISVGKKWNWNDLQRAILSDERPKQTMIDLLNTLGPTIVDNPTFLYQLVRIHKASNKPELRQVIDMYFAGRLKSRIRFADVRGLTGCVAPEFISSVHEAEVNIKFLENENLVYIMNAFPALWQNENVLRHVFSLHNAGDIVRKTGHILTMNDFKLAARIGNASITSLANDDTRKSLIAWAARSVDPKTLTFLLSVYVSDRRTAKEVYTMHPELKHHPEIEKHGHFWNRWSRHSDHGDAYIYR